MAFWHLLRSTVVTLLSWWFPENKCTKFDHNRSNGSRKKLSVTCIWDTFEIIFLYGKSGLLCLPKSVCLDVTRPRISQSVMCLNLNLSNGRDPLSSDKNIFENDSCIILLTLHTCAYSSIYKKLFKILRSST